MYLNKALTLIMGMQLLSPVACLAAVTGGAVAPSGGGFSINQGSLGGGGFGANGSLGSGSFGSGTGNQGVSNGFANTGNFTPLSNGQGYVNEFGQILPNSFVTGSGSQFQPLGNGSSSPVGSTINSILGFGGLGGWGYWGGGGGGMLSAIGGGGGGGGMMGLSPQTQTGYLANGRLLFPRVNNTSGVLEGWAPSVKSGPGGRAIGGPDKQIREWGPAYAVAAANRRLNRIAESAGRLAMGGGSTHSAFVAVTRSPDAAAIPMPVVYNRASGTGELMLLP